MNEAYEFGPVNLGDKGDEGDKLASAALSP
jgi:hypothetical protein